MINQDVSKKIVFVDALFEFGQKENIIKYNFSLNQSNNQNLN